MHIFPGCTGPAVNEKGTVKIPMAMMTHKDVKKAFAILWSQNTPLTRKRKRRVLRQPAIVPNQVAICAIVLQFPIGRTKGKM